MGLFDKKYCDVCGEKIKLLGNRKLEDGNLCKDCAKKLSPFFSERKSSTVEEIKQQLAYREENQAQLEHFRPTRTLGEYWKFYLDEPNGRFVVSNVSDWKQSNPDIISFEDVISRNVSVQDHRREVMRTNKNGEQVSYNPPRYEYSYDFYIELDVQNPYFNKIRIKINSGSVEIISEQQGSGFLGSVMTNVHPEYNPEYRKYQQMADEIIAALAPPSPHTTNTAPIRQTEQEPPAQASCWVCPSCQSTNESGKFCQSCGTPRPAQTNRCSQCGWTPAQGQPIPKFCPECGKPFA